MTADDRVRVICPLTTPQLVDVIVEFVTIFNEPAKIHIYQYQRGFIRRIIEAVLDNDGDVITGLWSRQSGKSEALACLATSLCLMLPTLAKAFPDDPRLVQYTRGFFIGIFAPKEKQSKIIYDRIRSRAEMESSLEVYADKDINTALAASRGDMVSWTNGSFVVAQTASEQSSVEGFTFHLVIIDEAQLVSKYKIHKEIAPMLAATNGTMIKIGTANALRGGFKESILYNLENERKGGKRNHFEYPYDVVIAQKRVAYEITQNMFHLNYEKWVNGELRRLGNNLDNEEFRQNFRLLWQEADLLAIDPEALEACKDETLEFCFRNYSSRHIVAGLDYAKKRDATILTIAEVLEEPVRDSRVRMRPGEEEPTFLKKRVLCFYEIQGRKWHEILSHVADICGQYAITNIVCDATGVGDPLTETLSDLLPGVRVVPFIMSHVGNDMVYKLYIQEIEAGRWIIPAGPKTRETHVWKQYFHQHAQLVKDRVGVYIKCYALEGEHDDFADSGALCCYAASLPVEAQVEEDVSPLFTSRLATMSDSYENDRSDRYRR
jgi:hypothetical protein